jgi:hypothetical protein
MSGLWLTVDLSRLLGRGDVASALSIRVATGHPRASVIGNRTSRPSAVGREHPARAQSHEPDDVNVVPSTRTCRRAGCGQGLAGASRPSSSAPACSALRSRTGWRRTSGWSPSSTRTARAVRKPPRATTRAFCASRTAAGGCGPQQRPDRSILIALSRDSRDVMDQPGQTDPELGAAGFDPATSRV